MLWNGVSPPKDQRGTERGALQWEDGVFDRKGRLWVVGTGFNAERRVMVRMFLFFFFYF